MEVRDAQPDDANAIRHVSRTTWDHAYRDTVPEKVRAEFVRRTYSDESLLQRIENDVFLVATRDDEVLGFADFRPAMEGPTELAAIYVLPEKQEQGLGSRLLATGIVQFAADTRFVLPVERDNGGALRFYEARGFRRSGEFTEVLFGHEFHDVEMVLEPGR